MVYRLPIGAIEKQPVRFGILASNLLSRKHNTVSLSLNGANWVPVDMVSLDKFICAGDIPAEHRDAELLYVRIRRAKDTKRPPHIAGFALLSE